MKLLVSYFISAIVMVAVFFAVAYWVIQMESKVAFISAISGVFAGVGVELFNKRRKSKLRDFEA